MNPGLWDSSKAGHVDAWESYQTCAIREIQEELGVMLSAPPQALFKLRASKQTGMEFCQVYHLVQDGHFQLNKEEIELGRQYALHEISAWINAGGNELTESFTAVWRTFHANHRD